MISFNIRFENPKDGEQDWPHRKPLANQLVEEFDTDILATQEGRRPQILDFASTFSKLKLHDSHRDWIDERMYPCLFYNPERIRITGSGDIWLSETPAEPGSRSFKSAFPRLCTWAKAEVIESQFKFFIINTHLDHIRWDTRANQIRVLVEEVSKLNDQNLPIILCGDFNESPYKKVREFINENWNQLQDPWLVHNQEETSSFHKFQGELSEKDGGARIDWILHDKRLNCQEIELDKRSSGGIYPSDHFPVKAIISI